MPCASPDSLLLESDVALVGELLAFGAAVGLETRQKHQEMELFRDKHNLPRSQRVFWANWSCEGRQEAMENPWKANWSMQV